MKNRKDKKKCESSEKKQKKTSRKKNITRGEKQDQ